MDPNPTRAPTPGELPAVWRQRAAFLTDYGDPNTARLWELAAVELERALQAFGDETLSLVEAARVSGYTSDYLGVLLKAGKLKNVGRKNAPRIRRADLPQKQSHGPGRPRRRHVPDITPNRR